MARYTALTPIKHDGKRYALGASIDLTKAEAEAMPDGTVEQTRADGSAARKASEKPGTDHKAQAEAGSAQKAEPDLPTADQTGADGKAAEQPDAGNGGAQG
jgi:hypothetical protein